MKFLSIVIFTFIFHEALCQVPSMNVPTHYSYVPELAVFAFHHPSMDHYLHGGKISHKYTFRVVMKDDSAFNARTRIDHKADIHTLTVKNGNKVKIKISPADTKRIYRIDGEGNRFYGVPADSCWLFKAQPGKINSYSFVAEKGMSYIIAIQHGDDGPVVPLTKENLLPMAGNDPKVLRLIEKGDLLRAVEFFNRIN